MSQWSALRDRAAGRWQIPLFVISLLLLGGAFLRLRSTPVRLPLSEAAAYLDSLVVGELYGRAAEIAEALLHREGDSAAERGPIHLQLARARFGETVGRPVALAEAGRDIVEHYRKAMELGEVLSGADFERLGQALEWRSQFVDAVDAYRQAVALGVRRSLDLRQHVLMLMRDRLGVPAEAYGEALAALLADAGENRLDLRLWAIEEQIHTLDELARLDEAATLLTREADLFRSSMLAERFAFLEALLLYKQRHFDQAELFLRTIRNRTDHFDDVHAMTGWLLGRVVMDDGGPQRPQEALSFFEDVIRRHRFGPFVLASRVGQGEALALMQRHDEAVDAFGLVLEELDEVSHRRVIHRDLLRTRLGVLAHAMRLEGDLQAARRYARLAANLIEGMPVEQATLVLQQLAQIQVQLAERLSETDRPVTPLPIEARRPVAAAAARPYFGEAARTHLEIRRLNILNERRSAQAKWEAAELFGRAGERDRAIELFTTFVAERPGDPLVPRALLRIGQWHHDAGRLSSAVAAYQACYRQFPRSLDGARALIPLAQCYLAMGGDGLDLAEKTLRVVLEESEVFTPEAPEFADALFLLGDVLARRGKFEHSIATLEEALQRYPDDPRRHQARFLLADGYRQSARALQEEAAEALFAGEVEQIRAAAMGRFQKARAQFRVLIHDLELVPNFELGRLERLYLRHAYLNEADGYFETQEYVQALKLYEEAAGLYKNQPASLAAYVQIINCHVFLGERHEARAALARALVLVDNMPDAAFAQSLSPETRQDWKRYFSWLGASELF